MPADNNSNAPAILWFRRDLRLNDNQALQAALASGRPTICLYIRDEPHAGAGGAAQAWWLHHSLTALDGDLRAIGNRLILRTGPPRSVIEEVVERTGAGLVVWNRRYDPESIETDSAIKAALRNRGVEVHSHGGFLMHEPSRLKTKQGKRYAVFTPFWRAFESQFQAHDDLPAPSHLPGWSRSLDGETLEQWNLAPRKPDWAREFGGYWRPGENGAIDRLADFIENRIEGYRANRDVPGRPATSGLSPHLAMGEISPHRIWNATAGLARDHDDVAFFRRELVWREFAWHLLFHEPRMRTASLDARFERFPWLSDTSALDAWRKGRTGYPIVDAGMRELWRTGYMHNRVRMIVASFLIKDLLIDWRAGERWFADTLVDIDNAANAMNWQWVAGCGPDASPWFRIFNPVRQGETFDPDGAYVRRFCPELAALPDAFIHRPFDAPESVLAKAGIRLGETYPRPLIAHDFARQRALSAFNALPKTGPGHATD